MDHGDRDDFYLSTPDGANDGDDYELEAPDADVLAAEERRARQAIEATQASIDIDEIYRDADRERSDEILQSWLRNFRFRFQVKHLLIATAVLAIVLTLAKWGLLGTAAMFLVMMSVAGLYFYLQWQEKKTQEEANHRRQQMYARRRAHFKKMSGQALSDEDQTTAVDDVPKAPLPLPNEVDQTWQEAMAQEKFHFRFSLAELMIAMTIAAVIFGLMHVLGGASNTATLLGFIALIGLIVHALGFQPPGVVVLGWWLILVLYVLLSIVAAMWSSFA